MTASRTRSRHLSSQHGGRHAGESGELIDQPSDRVDLSDDGGDRIGEKLRALLDLGKVFALQPLGRQADRCQRVLDLVSDAPRNLGPGRLPLREAAR